MKISIVVIGDELLLGQVSDTNSGAIARIIAPYGWSVEHVETVPDSAAAIVEAVSRAMSRSRIVITTGGLGPTRDDITVKALMQIFPGRLVENPQVLQNVKAMMQRRGLPLNNLTAAQAMVPDCADVIQNRYGTAPILLFHSGDTTVVSMPGVPAETEPMMRHEVMAALRQKYSSATHTLHTTLTIQGISESALAERLAAFEDALPQWLHLAYLPQASILRLRLDGNHTDGELLHGTHARALAQLKQLCADVLLYEGEHTPAMQLLNLLKKRGLTLATAESCTGGTIASMLTAIPGSSEAYCGSVVAYCNEAKQSLLGVQATTLAAHGAVSEPVVKQMAEGARKALNTDVALATSGIAGPGGATADKPVGTVCIAVATPSGTYTSTHHFGGTRTRIIERSALTALSLAIRTVPNILQIC
ncbi:MAG: CinA family nicotinamide mononucleotide deamidase-related protein [Muribaculaceae bacterium]|nr:CinA family nicotinamide mononucleotide deamidase-related protein [Muribaculaceae bacterium]